MNELKIIRPHLNPFILLKRTVVLFLFSFFIAVPLLFADAPPQKGGLTVESIQLVGNHRTRPQVIRNYLPFQEGDVISRHDVARLQVNLEESEFFKKVNVYTQPGSQRGKIQVFIEVKERKAPFFQVRGGFSQLDGWYISPIGLHLNNIFGRGHKLGAEFLIGDRVSGLTIGYIKP
ncbi:MAG: POTRA domain-containing protein, partial [Calditrichia bacterium]